MDLYNIVHINILFERINLIFDYINELSKQNWNEYIINEINCDRNKI